MNKTWPPTTCDQTNFWDKTQLGDLGRHCCLPTKANQRFPTAEVSYMPSCAKGCRAGWCCPKSGFGEYLASPPRWKANSQHLPRTSSTKGSCRDKGGVFKWPLPAQTGRCPIVTGFSVGMLKWNSFIWVTYEVPLYHFRVSSRDNTYDFQFHKWLWQETKPQNHHASCNYAVPCNPWARKQARGCSEKNLPEKHAQISG